MFDTVYIYSFKLPQGTSRHFCGHMESNTQPLDRESNSDPRLTALCLQPEIKVKYYSLCSGCLGGLASNSSVSFAQNDTPLG